MEITNDDEHDQALALMDELIDDYDNQIMLIELLSKSISRWEDISEDFAEFNDRIAGVDHAVSVLRVLMKHHGSGVADLPAIGSKSLVSKILNQSDRQLTRKHIEALRAGVKIKSHLWSSMHLTPLRCLSV